MVSEMRNRLRSGGVALRCDYSLSEGIVLPHSGCLTVMGRDRSFLIALEKSRRHGDLLE